MPFYRFQIEVPLPQQSVMERVRSLVPKGPTLRQLFGELRKLKFREWFSEQRTPQGSTLTPFIGSADEDSFRMTRRIRGRNSLLPLIRGHVLPIPTGAQINVTMFMWPPTAVIVTAWLGMSGAFAIIGIRLGSIVILAASAGVLLCVALMCGEFFWEAFKAKRILTDTFSDSENNP
jgi:hypothetical protein